MNPPLGAVRILNWSSGPPGHLDVVTEGGAAHTAGI